MWLRRKLRKFLKYLPYLKILQIVNIINLIGKLLLIDCKYRLWLYYREKLYFYNFIDNYDSDKKITYITPCLL